jgi:hypothetical protein
MTEAAYNALAYVHLTGRMPKYIRHHTWMAVYWMVDSVPFDVSNPGGPDKVVKQEHAATAEAHPMVATVRQLQAAGWSIDKNLGRRRVRSGIGLVKPGLHRTAETAVYPDGKQGRVWGEEKSPASLTS